MSDGRLGSSQDLQYCTYSIPPTVPTGILCCVPLPVVKLPSSSSATLLITT